MSSSEDAQTASEQAAPSEDSADFVYTTDYLKKRLAESEETPTVYTNEDLAEEESDEPEALPETTFTNDDLRERFGNEGAEDAAEEPVEDAAEEPEAEAPAEPPAEPAMSSTERTQLIARIDGDLRRLEKRILAIHNPLLAGTVPSTEEEQVAEAGMDNVERLQRTEAKIDELKSVLDELRTAEEQGE